MPDRPDIDARPRAHPVQAVRCGPGAGGGHNAPGAAVPMLDHRLTAVATEAVVAADGPDIVGRHRRHPIKPAVIARAGDEGPGVAVPMFHRSEERRVGKEWRCPWA